MSSSNSLVWAHLPQGGLGNKLFVWARAAVYAHKHGVPLLTSGWQNRIGLRTWLLGGGLRRYANDFLRCDKNQLTAARLLSKTRLSLVEPDFEQSPPENSLICFQNVPCWKDYFGSLRPHRDYVRDEIPKILTPHCRSQVESLDSPPIAIHVRMGDFKKIPPGADFATLGSTRTPLDYFILAIENIRRVAGYPVAVVVFSDGKTRELQPILSVSNVVRAASKSAMVDLMHMSKSRLLITSAGSTFSYWSGFLGDQPLILHRDHIHSTIRPETAEVYEGGIDDSTDTWSPLLLKNICKAFKNS